MSLLLGLSRRLLLLEKILAGGLAAAVALLILLNVVTRSADMALYWVDELAIQAMVWMALIAASVALRQRDMVAVTLLPDAVGPAARRILGRIVDLCVLAFAVVLAVLCWRWFDPLTLAGMDWNTQDFAGKTANFIYSEPTQTIGMAKWWLWLVVPWVALTMTIHALANIVDDLRGREPAGNQAKPEGQAR